MSPKNLEVKDYKTLHVCIYGETSHTTLGQVKTSSTSTPAYQVLVLYYHNCLFSCPKTFGTHAVRPSQIQLELILSESDKSW